jgi:group I intron endonuclease
MKGIIYCFHCISNGKKYIGMTEKGLEYRVKQHINNVNRNYKVSRKFYNCIKKYGIQNFIIAIVEECDVNNLSEREKYYIEKYDTYRKGLNSTLGGEGTSGWKHTKESRDKIKQRRKYQVLTEEHKEKLRGYKHTEEWKQKQREWMTGREVKYETRLKLSQSQKGRKGRPISEEQRKKQSEKLKGNPKTKEHAENIKKSKQGVRWWTNEIENKMSKQCPGDDWRIGKTSNPLPGRIGAIWWNNGIQNKCCRECPEEGWIKGKIRKKVDFKPNNNYNSKK